MADGDLKRLRVEYFANEKKTKIYVDGALVTEVEVARAIIIETRFDPRHFLVMNLVGGTEVAGSVSEALDTKPRSP